MLRDARNARLRVPAAQKRRKYLDGKAED